MFILQGSRTADKQSKAGEDAPAAYVPQIMPGEIRLQKGKYILFRCIYIHIYINIHRIARLGPSR